MREAEESLSRPIDPDVLELELGEYLKERQDRALIYCDLRNFRLYNQLYGRKLGDRMLSSLAQLLARSLEPDEYYYRIGGDEFLLVVLSHRAESLAQELCREWQALSPGFYTERDQHRRFLLGTDRRGIGRRCPLVELNIGVVHASPYRGKGLSEVFSAAVETNLAARSQPGTTYVVNQETLSHASWTASSPSVLVVEPDAALAYLLQTALEINGYQVWVTSSGQEAFKLAIIHRPKVIILDLYTSDLPAGPYLCTELRRQPELSQALLIVAATNADREESLSAGADLFIPKPFELSDLLQWVDRLVEENAKVVDLPGILDSFNDFQTPPH
jgi:PleD family two-component response regulator